MVQTATSSPSADVLGVRLHGLLVMQEVWVYASEEYADVRRFVASPPLRKLPLAALLWDQCALRTAGLLKTIPESSLLLMGLGGPPRIQNADLCGAVSLGPPDLRWPAAMLFL